MLAEPRQPSFDGRWLEFGCHHACRHSGVVNLNYGRQISLNSITDDHFVQGTVDTASKLDSAPRIRRSRLTFLDRAPRYGGGARWGVRRVGGGGSPLGAERERK